MAACNEFTLAAGKALKASSIGSLAAKRPSTPRNVEPGADKIAARSKGRDAGCGAALKAHDFSQPYHDTTPDSADTALSRVLTRIGLTRQATCR